MAKKKSDKADMPSAPEIQVSEPRVEFDTWWGMRSANIPAHHHKEILRADFSARGLSVSETVASFDEALKKYGVKLS